jgi:trimeric autotransporter adhesin
MNPVIQLKTITPPLLITLTLLCFGLLPKVQAVGPDTEGNIPGANNGEGVGVLVSRTTGIWNTGAGFEALNHLTVGNQNTATGLRALFSDTGGGFNTATGVYALFANTTGFFNSATGAYSLTNNTIGNFNTASGYGALYFNTEGERNTATGFAALYKNTTGVGNTANGLHALSSNTTGHSNTANGDRALSINITGFNNTATGARALSSNTTGAGNTAVGLSALDSNTTGNGNTANGDRALSSNTTGHSNVALGVFAGSAQTTGSNNIYIGANVQGVAGESNACYIASIFNRPSAPGAPVIVNVGNKLGTVASSKRFKEDIRPMARASEALFSLNPVSFRYKNEIDPIGTSQLGLVAEEVEKVNPDLIVRDKEGKPYSVRYEQVNAMLLNEFLKEHRTVQELKAIVAEQQKQIEALTAGLQKVCAQIEARKSAPLTVVNNQ